MRVQIWHSPQLNEWRWSLYTKTYAPKGDNHQQTGSRKEIRDAMNDVADTIEHLIVLKEKGCDSEGINI